jgi:hypothetical protein
MRPSLFALSALATAVILAGCASQETAPAQSTTAASAPAAPKAAPAPALSDAALAEKFKGQWTGEWVMPGVASGKFVFIASSVEGTNIKGEAHWYATAAGDLKLPLLKAYVEKGVLKAEQVGDTKFKLKMKGDNELVGDWDIKGYTGDLKVKR